MDEGPEIRRRRRLALIAGGSMDMLIGGAIALAALGWLPVHPSDFGLPDWLVLLIGAVLAFGGVAVVFYNLSRLNEES
jgi:hypothetical protein